MAEAPDLKISFGGIPLRNPVMVASGTFGYGVEYADLIDIEKLGAIVVKGIRLSEWDGNRPPRMVEVPGGLVNAIGLQGPGVDGFVSEYLPRLREQDVPVIVNIWGTTVEEYGEVAARLSDVEGIAGLELNISCPNVKEGGIAFGTDPVMAGRVIAEVRVCTSLPIIPKLSPNVPSVAPFVKVAEAEGSNAIAMINTLPAMVIDIESRRPILSNVVGGLSGPAIHPVAVKQVWEAAQVASVPIVAMGGITSAAEAIEFMIAGASAVAVGTANFTDPETPLRVVDGIRDYLEQHDMKSVEALVGSILL